MNRLIVILSLVVLSVQAKSPYEIIDNSPDSAWRDINPEQTLYITLETGVVVVELAPQFVPNHVDNTKKLVREGVFDNTSFYRVVDGFVAQGGPADPEKIAKPKVGKLTIPAEFTVKPKKPLDFTPIGLADGYAPQTGFIGGFAAAFDKSKGEYWMTHCYGTLAMGRGNSADSGGTELYIVIGSAQRYLDKNTTVFGRVITGMEHIQHLQRSSNLKGAVDMNGKNKIISIKVASDLNLKERIALETMKTNSQSFKDIIKSRKNRNSEWFLYQHNYIDICSISIPVRLKNNKIKSFK